MNNFLYDIQIILKMCLQLDSILSRKLYELIKAINPVSFEIIHRRNIDQIEWKRIIRNVDIKMLRNQQNINEYKEIDRIMHENTIFLKSIVKKYGGISHKKFGLLACHCAWLIVQHSDEDFAFQCQYLIIMTNDIANYKPQYIKSLQRRIAHHKDIIALRNI